MSGGLVGSTSTWLVGGLVALCLLLVATVGVLLYFVQSRKGGIDQPTPEEEEVLLSRPRKTTAPRSPARSPADRRRDSSMSTHSTASTSKKTTKKKKGGEPSSPQPFVEGTSFGGGAGFFAGEKGTATGGESMKRVESDLQRMMLGEWVRGVEVILFSHFRLGTGSTTGPKTSSRPHNVTIYLDGEELVWSKDRALGSRSYRISVREVVDITPGRLPLTGRFKNVKRHAFSPKPNDRYVTIVTMNEALELEAGSEEEAAGILAGLKVVKSTFPPKGDEAA